MKRRAVIVFVATLWLHVSPIHGYPLDAYEATGIARLEGYRLAQEGRVIGRQLPEGALLSSGQIVLRLADQPGFELPTPDPGLGASLKEFLGADAPKYGIALLDLTDPAQPRYAEYNGAMVQNPGSVGKLMIGVALFQNLADLYPDDIEARRRLLRETEIGSNGFIMHDGHTVPFWKPGMAQVLSRPLREGDSGNLWTFLDWMMSSSSNAAASMVMSQIVLLKHFGKEYPVSDERAAAFFKQTPKSELTKILLDAMLPPLTRNGLDKDRLRQGSFFTAEGKRRVPGTNSVGTSRDFMRLIVKMEQGKLVDRFSSEEIKRLIYLTDRRIRYAASPALSDAAVFFKSGSLYSCKQESGFKCGKYMGNVRNYMNSVAIVETEQQDGVLPLRYAVVVMSNVLRKNSAAEHQTLATRIHRLMQEAHPAPSAEPVPAATSMPESTTGAQP
jgi:hypothetical protein